MQDINKECLEQLERRYRVLLLMVNTSYGKINPIYLEDKYIHTEFTLLKELIRAFKVYNHIKGDR